MPRRGTLLRSDQYANCAKRHSVSSSEAKPWALYLTRMRVNAQEEKRKHGITCNTSSPLGDGSPAEGLPSLASSKEAPSLPTKAPSYEAKRPAPKAQDRVPRRGTLLRSGQYGNCAKRYSVSSFRAKSRNLPCRPRGDASRRFFIKGDARKWYWYSSHGLPVITTIRVGPWRRKSRRGTSEFGLIQRGA